jgi:hypothetical protein
MAKRVRIYCPRHAGERHELRDEQGHLPDFSKLLGTGEGLRKTTKWVMQRGILGQFGGTRDTLYGSFLSLSLAQDWFWHGFEVLEATGNFTEDTLKGGGLYSPEGFSFQKHVTSRSSAWTMPPSA